MNTLPYIAGSGRSAVLHVDGKPFYIRGGELHNSSASSPEYMREKVWPAIRHLHMNTVLAPVYWECLEPEEGLFDYTLVDSLISQAREEHMRLVILWFGLWKNGASTYVPAWVKRDRKRFWYVEDASGKAPVYFNQPVLTLSPLCREAVDADARAFSSLMQHIRDTDGEHTVIMVQVENEVGVLGSARDHSAEAEKAFSGEIPPRVAEHFKVSGTWTDAFGQDAEESFMAWHYALAVEQICRAGRDVLDLPMYANAWLVQKSRIPGTYPSGGPQYKNAELWKLAAPSIDLLAPDIYVDDYFGTVQEYGTDRNPLFIPETRMEAAFYLYAVGNCNVMCFSPFGAEDCSEDSTGMDTHTLSLLNISPDALSGMYQAGEKLAKAYRYVEQMESLILRAHQENRIFGFLFHGESSEALSVGPVTIHVQYETSETDPRIGGGLVIELGPYEYLILATSCSVTFSENHGKSLDMLAKEEGSYRQGVWTRGRILNGDERYRHLFGNDVTSIRFQLLPY